MRSYKVSRGRSHSPANNRFILPLALLVTCLMWATSAFAADPFVIQDIRVEGLQRISAGTVFNYLPIKPGDKIDSAEVKDVIRVLYKTKKIILK